MNPERQLDPDYEDLTIEHIWDDLSNSACPASDAYGIEDGIDRCAVSRIVAENCHNHAELGREMVKLYSAAIKAAV